MGVKNTKSGPDNIFVRILNLKKFQLDNFESAKMTKCCDVRNKNMLIDTYFYCLLVFVALACLEFPCAS